MSSQREFNPIAAARHIEHSYREYLSSTIHFSDRTLQTQLENLLSKRNYLTKGPFLEAAPPYVKDKSIRQLVDEGILCKGMLTLGGGDPEKFNPDRPLYTHQVQAITKARMGRNLAVVTGTGSGKTECFLLPILDDILREFEEIGHVESGIRAMILYPMNALANDQLKRLRELLVGTPITFGRYTGDTEETEGRAEVRWSEENPGATKLPNEILSRQEIRENPPNILLTNYSMLEYLLLRPSDAPLFEGPFGSTWRHIAIDEAHVYSGSLGTEIAYLLRRLKARIASSTGVSPKLHCYATSATIGSRKDMPQVASFAQELFGEPFSSDPNDLDVITSQQDHPQDALDKTPWGRLKLSTWTSLRGILLENDEPNNSELQAALSQGGAPSNILARMSNVPTMLGLGRVLLGEESTGALVRRCENLLDLTDIKNIEEIGIPELNGDDEGISILTAMVEVLSSAQRSEDVPILSSRYHSFLRAPEGLYINLRDKKLVAHKTTSVDYDGEHCMPIYEISVCRHCGQAYILGKEASVASAGTSWLNPEHEGTNAADDFIPRTYYRILPNEVEADPTEQIKWICPVCGSLHGNRDGGNHLFKHESVNRVPIAVDQSEETAPDEYVARCYHCGYQSNNAIQPMRVSPEAAGSVVCYDLVRDIPPFAEEPDQGQEDDPFSYLDTKDEEKRAGSVICFSDKRQDAAFFAPAMERTYNSITRRQLIREAIEAASFEDPEAGCSPSKAIRWIAEKGRDLYPKLFTTTDARDEACAWLIDEMCSEDSRNSLNGLGVIRMEPAEFIRKLSVAKRGVERIIAKELKGEEFSWLSVDDFLLFLNVCLETVREDGGITVPEGVANLRNNHKKRAQRVIAGNKGAPDEKGRSNVIRFVGSVKNTENRRSTFIRKYAKTVRGVSLSRENTAELLMALYNFLVKYLNRFFPDLINTTGNAFTLDKDLWQLYPHNSGDTIYRCDTCACETHLDTKGVCLTSKCMGHMQRMSLATVSEKDRYYRDIYQQEALPVSIEEHTAQLSSTKAREIQSEFIKGNVNVLSCTTTFELGVDVGDLRAIFMRNVPPTTANYTQRAGRVGRRAGKPGFAVTFARLRPHDIAHFNKPERIIAGNTRAPSCYLDNEAIACRHVFAVALSEFFRYSQQLHDPDSTDYSHYYHSFMNLSEECPSGLVELREFLSTRPDSLFRQIDQLIPASLPLRKQLGIDDWGWVPKLIGEPTLSHREGRLIRTHDLKHGDYARVLQGIEEKRGSDPGATASLYKTLEALEKQQTIAILAENGVLPKYGFPTDLVELHLPEVEMTSEPNRLSLQRGLRQAIYEYAPGAEIVAGKKLWRSVGLRKPRGRNLQVRRYGKCPSCGTFIWPIENASDKAECPVCHQEVTLTKKMLVPEYGFEGKSENKGIGLRRPRSKGYAKIYFSQHWPEETETEDVKYPGGIVSVRSAANAQLCVVNEPRNGIHVCNYCHAASVESSNKIEHWPWCNETHSTVKPYSALGTAFVSDVVELTFTQLDLEEDIAPESWESLQWAIFTAASRILEIPETELGGTTYRSDHNEYSVLIYDNVPGGAGHARQLRKLIPELIDTAHQIVSNCTCSEDTCCYGCIASYYNQAVQYRLSRGAALRILSALLGKADGVISGSS